MNKRRQGRRYEAWAKQFLIQQGLIFLQENYYCRYGELDLIMQYNEILVFVEVRYRRNASYGTAQESITTTKKRRVYLTAQHWMQSFGYDLITCHCRFDVIAITGTQFDWLKNILILDEL